MPKLPRLPVIVNNIIMIFLAVILAAIWIAFAPAKVGGSASYVMVSGNSMEPGFYSGDLVIIKPASIYQTGDIITYRDPQLRQFVIHRIINIDQKRYILKGDNNTWIDTYNPTQEEIVGKLWIHAPKLGLAIYWLRLPANMALVVGILGGVLMIGQNTQQKQQGKKKNKPQGGSSSTGWVEVAIYTLGFLTLAFFALSTYAFIKPVTIPGDDIEYEQTGVYYYSAAMPAGIFDSETLHSGEPIFTQLTCSIIVGYSYNISGPVQDISGTQQLIVRVADEGSGWGRTIPLTPSTSFNGTSYSTTATVDLCQFQALVDSVGEKTGFTPRTTLTIISKIAVSGTTLGQNLFDTFDSNLVLGFDGVHFYLVKTGQTNPLENSATADPLQSSKLGKIANPFVKANTVKFLGLEINIVGLRALSIGGLSISLLGLLILGWYIYEVSKHSPVALIRIRYGAMLMEVNNRSLENISSVIDVSGIDDLAKLAERQNAMILHTTHNSLHYFFVQSDGTTYRYVDKKDHKEEMKQVERHEIQQAITPPVEVEPDLENTSSQIAIDGPTHPNFIPKKITIAYDGPLPTNEQGMPELPITAK